MACRSENSFIKTLLVIKVQLSVLQQLLLKGGWAGKQKEEQAPGDPGRSRGQAAPRLCSLGQPAPPAAAWFGALSALGTQSSFSQGGVCPQMQTSLQCGVKPLYQTVENTREALP